MRFLVILLIGVAAVIFILHHRGHKKSMHQGAVESSQVSGHTPAKKGQMSPDAKNVY